MRKAFYGVLLIALLESIALVVTAFGYADAARGYDALGGEVFMIALPLAILFLGIRTVGRKR